VREFIRHDCQYVSGPWIITNKQPANTSETSSVTEIQPLRLIDSRYYHLDMLSLLLVADENGKWTHLPNRLRSLSKRLG
jgi:hypothetical protein